MKKTNYTDIDFESVELEEGEQDYQSKRRYSRISIPSHPENIRRFYEKGYLLVDRTLEVKIPLKRNLTDFEKYIRMPVIQTSDCMEEIREIAYDSFTLDNRFRVTTEDNWKEIYIKILDEWIGRMQMPYVCLYKEKPIGFMEITEDEKGIPFIHLAATDEKYRLTGAGMTIYSYVVNQYKQFEKKAIMGRISSRNTAVMNIYTALGGQFSNPWDIFIKL